MKLYRFYILPKPTGRRKWLPVISTLVQHWDASNAYRLIRSQDILGVWTGGPSYIIAWEEYTTPGVIRNTTPDKILACDLAAFLRNKVTE